METAPVAGVPAETSASGWGRESRLVRAVQRIPRPLGTKLLVAFTLIALLLALVAVVGLVALGQSNSRGRELQKLQAADAYVQQVKADSNKLLGLVGICGDIFPVTYECRPVPASRQTYAVLDGLITSSANDLIAELQVPALGASESSLPSGVVRPAVAELNAFQRAYANVSPIPAGGGRPEGGIRSRLTVPMERSGAATAFWLGRD